MNTTVQTNNKRIAKNTIFLYIRMLMIMAVGLFTSRVNLAALGISDYGIYNVVGGIVSVLAFLNGAMSAGTQRFLNFEMGTGNKDELKKVFITSLLIHGAIAFVFFLFAETVGLWFLNYKMNVPIDRINAANWVYQFSILSFMVSMISVPYNAAIIAHEKMSAFAYIGILEAVLKLIVAFLLYYSPFDKLVYFACLNFSIVVLLRIIYQIYSRKNFEETRISSWHVDKAKLKEMMSFSGWVIFGSLSGIFHTQGIGIVMNLFFGVTVNAAQGVANQVNGIVKHFIQNFTVALNPQITKNFAAGHLVEMHKLLIRGCKLAFCMVAFFALPIIIECPMILNLWLKEVPEYTVIFIRVIMLITLCDSFSSPLAASKNATGKIKSYQLVLTALGLSHIPLAYMFFKMGCGPDYAMYVYLFLILCMQSFRIYQVCKSISLSKLTFLKEVVSRCILVVMISAAIPLILHKCIPASIISTIGVILCCIISVSISSFIIAFNSSERHSIVQLVTNKIHKNRHVL